MFKKKNIFYVLIILLFSSCTNNIVFTEFKSIPNGNWDKENKVNFTFTATDSLSKNKVFIHLRNNNKYDFNNIFLIVNVNYPNKRKVVDTLEYKMADKMGYYLGSGFTDVKESKLLFNEEIIFPITGEYQYSIEQAMRKNGKANGVFELEGITDVGISIEKIISKS